MRMSRALCFGFMAAACRFALAQPGIPGWNIEVIGGPVSPSNPSVTVRVWARFDPIDHAFATGWFDVHAREGEWSDAVVLTPPPWRPGEIVGSTVKDIVLWNNANMCPSFFSNPANPLAVWEAKLTIDVFRPRVIPLETITHRLFVYPELCVPMARSPEFRTEGSATIRVVPCPPVATTAAWVVVLMSRRRTSP